MGTPTVDFWSGLDVSLYPYCDIFWQSVFSKELSFLIILPFILNLIFNLSFTPIQFGLQNNFLAAVDIILIWLTIIWLMFNIFPIIPWIAYLQIPYIIWVTVATTLQLKITYMNR
jgi:benzodiazapine receptor